MLLEQQLKISDLTEVYPDLMQKYGSNPEVTIKAYGGKDYVNYDSVGNIKKNVRASDLQNIAVHLRKIIYTKSDKFCDDKEYRFAFVIHHSLLGVINVKPEPKILTINSSLLNCFS